MYAKKQVDKKMLNDSRLRNKEEEMMGNKCEILMNVYIRGNLWLVSFLKEVKEKNSAIENIHENSDDIPTSWGIEQKLWEVDLMFNS